MAELWGLEGSVSFFMRRSVHLQEGMFRICLLFCKMAITAGG